MVPSSRLTFESQYNELISIFNKNTYFKEFNSADLNEIYPVMSQNQKSQQTSPATELQVFFKKLIEDFDELEEPSIELKNQNPQLDIIYRWCSSIKKVVDQEQAQDSLFRTKIIPHQMDFSLMMRYLVASQDLSENYHNLSDFFKFDNQKAPLTQLINQVKFYDPMIQKNPQTTAFSPQTLERLDILSDHFAQQCLFDNDKDLQDFLGAVGRKIQELRSSSGNFQLEHFFLEKFYESIERKFKQEQEMVPLKTEQDLLFEKLFRSFQPICADSSVYLEKSQSAAFTLNFENMWAEPLATCTVDENCLVRTTFLSHSQEINELMPSIIKTQIEIAPNSSVNIDFKCYNAEDVQKLFDLTQSICQKNPDIFNILKFNVQSSLENESLPENLAKFIDSVMTNNFSIEMQDTLKQRKRLSL